MLIKMNKNCLFIMLLSALLVLPVSAQRQKTPVKKQKAPVVEVEEEPSRFDEMLEGTQKIVFVDSIVVKKQDFLQYYRMTAEAGSIMGYNQFFKSEDQPYSTVYVNQLGNKCWYAANGKLYTADRFNNQWGQPAELEGLGTFQRLNYPYMLSDGTTFYFAAISSEGLGGLDIYVSRCDAETGRFLQAENLGLPFNSEANDYMYAVDEINDIGYFATDRRQPDGMVCIYTFIPNQRRTVYSADEFDEDVIRSRARIDRIADTWGNGAARKEAVDRLMAMTTTAAVQDMRDQGLPFVINDHIVYTGLSDFRDAGNHGRLTDLCSMRERYETLGSAIEEMRKNYATTGNANEKNKLKKEILDGEKKYYQLENNIHQLEKAIRNSEIKALK